MRTQRPVVARLVLALALLAATAAAAHDWNDRRIRWQSYSSGLTTAKLTRKPVCLVVYTDWCPQCGRYAKLFHDDRVVQAARDFVMIRVDSDTDEAIAKRHAPDGEYFPRTVFLAPDGRFAPGVRSSGRTSGYNFVGDDPSRLLAAMSSARALR